MKGAILAIALLASPVISANPDIPVPEPETPAESEAIDGTELLSRYAELMEASSFAEAADVAKALVVEAIGRDAPSVERAATLDRLAEAQLLAGEGYAAVQNYQASIALIEETADRLDRRLIGPVRGMAQALFAIGEPADACRAWERAIHISHVNFGPINSAQAPILDELIEAYSSIGNVDRALALQEVELEIYRRHLALRDPKMTRAWRRKSRLFAEAGRHRESQDTLEGAIDVLTSEYGPNTFVQMPLIVDLAESYLYHAQADRFTRVEMARNQLERAAAIAEDNPSVDRLEQAEAQLRLGDLLQRYGDWHAAVKRYRKAWHMLSGGNGELLAHRAENFGQPVLLAGEDLVLPDDALIERFAEPRVEVTHSVDRWGRVTGRIDTDIDDGDLRKLAASAAREAVFRPRFEDGDPVRADRISRPIAVSTE